MTCNYRTACVQGMVQSSLVSADADVQSELQDELEIIRQLGLRKS